MIYLAAVFLVGGAATTSTVARASISQGPGAPEQPVLSNPEGKALLAKVIKALGGEEKVRAVKSVRAKFVERVKEAEDGENEVQSETIVLHPCRLWQKVLSPDSRGETVVISPKAAFTTEEMTEEMPPPLKADNLREMARDPIFVAQHADDPTFVFRAGGFAKVGSVDAKILDVSHPAGEVGYPAASVRWFIDSEGRIIRATWEKSLTDSLGSKGEQTHGVPCRKTTEDYSDWKLVEGVLFAFKEVDTCEGERNSTISLDFKLFEVNPKFDPKIFQQPGSVEEPSASNSEGIGLLAQVVQSLGGEAKVRSVRSVRLKGRTQLRSISSRKQESESETIIVFPSRIWLRRSEPARGEEATVAASPQGIFDTVGISEKKITQEIPAWAGQDFFDKAGRDPHREFVYVAQHAGDPNFIFYGAGKAKISGIETRILDVSTPLTDVRWFVDPRTGRILRSSRREKKELRSDRTWVEVTEYADWRSVDGVWFPFLEKRASSPGEAEFTEFVASEIQINPKVDLTIFEKPTYPVVQLPELKALAGARLIRIQDGWGGLGPSRSAHYELHPSENQFTGEATFSVGGLNKTENIQIPFNAAQTFFRILGEASLENKEYFPQIWHTDDYPSLKIELDLEDEAVTFFTESQGESHVPWAVKIGEKTYVIDSDVPARALAALNPYLKRDVMKKLHDELFPLKRQ